MRLLTCAILALASVSVRSEPILEFGTGSQTIPCGTSPFGRYVTIGRNAEFALMQIGFSAANDYVRSYDRDFSLDASGSVRSLAAFGSGTLPLQALAVDLNGDGRDEWVVLGRKADNNVLVAVYRPNGATLELVDTWTIARALQPDAATNPRPRAAQIIAGDFDGSRDGRMELAVLTRPSTVPTSAHVDLLTGDANGLIAQADGASAAHWVFQSDAANIFSGNQSLAAADLLLTGRDQLVYLAEVNGHLNTRTLRYHLLEFEDASYNGFLTVQPGNTGWASQTFTDAIGSTFDGQTIVTSGVRVLDLDAGDLVDSAQAELVLHIDAELSSNQRIIGQRLYRWLTTRDASNTITGITFQTLDTQTIQSPSDPVSWEAAIGNMDSVSPAEIVIARGIPGTQILRVEGYKVERFDDGPPNPPFGLRIRDTATYDADYTSATAPSSDMRRVQIAISDMNSDSVAEVMTVHQEPDGTSAGRLVLARYSLAASLEPVTFVGESLNIALSSDNIRLDIAAADFDGDSVFGTIGTDCRRITEPQVRSVVWWPPYFDTLQGNSGNFLATFGKTRTQGSSEETSFGTYTSHSVSGYLGGSVTVEVSGIGASGAVRATAGASYQASTGAIHGTEITVERSESLAQTQGDGLVVVEENVFDCYQFNVDQQNNALPGDLGVVRMCEVLDGTKIVAGTDQQNWDTLLANQAGGGTPAQWIPLHHEWASLSLFRPVETNASGDVANEITDGLFGTAFDSSLRSQPYVQIDLGSVQPVTNIRLFPVAGESKSLAGFRVYLSDSPMVGDAVPSGPGVAAFSSGIAADFGYDRINIHTRDANDAPRPTRYIRVQHPSATAQFKLAELQVFGEVHVEPNAYPQSVCDPIANDDRHLVRVWDGTGFRTIEQRGDLYWNATTADAACGSNHVTLPVSPIWDTIAIGDSAIASWDLAEAQSNLIGNSTSVDANVSVGAEFDVSGGFVAQVEAGGGYEFSLGITEERQSTTYWGTGLMIGGAAGGFNNPSLVTTCRYRPQPYAVKLKERSNTGYLHEIYLVDYVVREQAPFWSRAAVPDACLGIVRPDPVFASGFE